MSRAVARRPSLPATRRFVMVGSHRTSARKSVFCCRPNVMNWSKRPKMLQPCLRLFKSSAFSCPNGLHGLSVRRCPWRCWIASNYPPPYTRKHLHAIKIHCNAKSCKSLPVKPAIIPGLPACLPRLKHSGFAMHRASLKDLDPRT